MKNLLVFLIFLTSFSVLATNSMIENSVKCSFQEGGKEFASRPVYTDSNVMVTEGYFVIDDEYLHYRLDRDSNNILGLRVKYSDDLYNQFHSFGNGSDISFEGKIEDINVSYQCNGTWNI